jgi:hypothetical protein
MFSGSFKHEDSLHVRAVVDRGVRDLLELDRLTAALPDVRGADPLRLGIYNAIFQGGCGEAREDHGVGAANARAS